MFVQSIVASRSYVHRYGTLCQIAEVDSHFNELDFLAIAIPDRDDG